MHFPLHSSKVFSLNALEIPGKLSSKTLVEVTNLKILNSFPCHSQQYSLKTGFSSKQCVMNVDGTDPSALLIVGMKHGLKI